MKGVTKLFSFVEGRREREKALLWLEKGVSLVFGTFFLPFVAFSSRELSCVLELRCAEGESFLLAPASSPVPTSDNVAVKFVIALELM